MLTRCEPVSLMLEEAEPFIAEGAGVGDGESPGAGESADGAAAGSGPTSAETLADGVTVTSGKGTVDGVLMAAAVEMQTTSDGEGHVQNPEIRILG